MTRVDFSDESRFCIIGVHIWQEFRISRKENQNEPIPMILSSSSAMIWSIIYNERLMDSRYIFDHESTTGDSYINNLICYDLTRLQSL